MEDLPPIDAVLISHNHFDHLDLPTLRQLGTRGRSTFVVAARCARLLRSQGIEWFTSWIWEGHWPFSEAPSTAHRPCTSQPAAFLTAQIREKFGAPQLALLPIGAYEPRWFMSPVHMAPEEAVRAAMGPFNWRMTASTLHRSDFWACMRDDSFLILRNSRSLEIPC